MNDIHTFQPRIEARLAEIFDDAIVSAGQIDPQYAELLTVTRDQLLRGGKRLRPYLTYAAYLGCGGSDSADILTAAASQELFHLYLIIHDDVMDRDLLRHGGPNVAGTYYDQLRRRSVPDAQAYHLGASHALIAGNACCALGLQALAATGFAPEIKLRAMDAAHRMLLEEMGGQLSDLTAALADKGAPTLEQLLKICRYKTACYTFETPLQIGAVLAGADAATVSGLVDFGRALGVAFQLADDLLGVYGDEAVTGKPILSDMQEGKQTVLIHYALSGATPEQSKALRRIWGRADSAHAQLMAARELIEATGARDQVQKLMRTYFDDGLRALEATNLTRDAKSELIRTAHFSIERHY